jgi:6-phosphofructokinase
MNIGILTAGGVCPGVNNVVRSIVLRERNQGNKVIGFSDGFRGVNNGVYIPLECDCGGTDSLLRVSYDYVDMDTAVHNIKKIDRLYCVCGNESMKSARDLALDDRVATNIIGIPKTIYNDIAGVECIGFQTAVQELARYIDCAYVEATVSNSIVFLEVPGMYVNDLAIHAALARNSKVATVILPNTDEIDHRRSIEYGYATRGYAVVVISEMCDIIEGLSVKPKVIAPGYLIRDVEPCVYDSILVERIVREAFEYAQDHRDFIKGAGVVIPFKDYLRIV